MAPVTLRSDLPVTKSVDNFESVLPKFVADHDCRPVLIQTLLASSQCSCRLALQSSPVHCCLQNSLPSARTLTSQATLSLHGALLRSMDDKGTHLPGLIQQAPSEHLRGVGTVLIQSPGKLGQTLRAGLGAAIEALSLLPK